MTGMSNHPGRSPERRTLLYSHDTFGLGHLRRSRTIAASLVDADATGTALIVTGSPIAGRFDFPKRVDHVRLPGVVKLADGSYTSLSLRMDIDQMVSLRGAIIRSAADEFDPDLVIVDKEPWGFRGELAETLPRLRERGARIVLGVRDVLDDENALAREWERKGAIEAIERFYDEIWIYGIPEICEPLSGLGLSRRMKQRIVYTGYLRRDPSDWPDETRAEFGDAPYVLVTTGGGGDGVELVDRVIRVYEQGPEPGIRALIVYGPFMPAAERASFEQRIARLQGRVQAVGFHARLEQLLADAQGVVAMGGYNTFCEILSMDKPAVIAPRTHPRREQVIRAAAAEKLGLVRMLCPDRDGDTVEAMSRAIRALADQAPPSTIRIPGLMGGLDTIAQRAHLDALDYAVAGA